MKKLRPVLPYGVLANLAQWLTRYAHEVDFEVFEWLHDSRALVLDVGACRGQSALSVLRRTRRMRVVSVEPNPKHRWSLMFISLLHPFRFRFHMLAAGEKPGLETLHVPGRRASGLSAQASLDPDEFEKDYVQDRLAESGFDASNKSAYRLVPVQVAPLDSLGLAPDMIKLDVEGFESQALRGLQQTLRSGYPALLIEVNNTQRWLPFLTELGYGFYHFDPARKLLSETTNPGQMLNLFCLHPGSDSIISRILMQHLKK
jgi:FkbM family methyltransferase